MLTVAPLLAWLLAVYGLAESMSKARIGAPLRRQFPLRKTDSIEPDGQAVTFAHLIRCPKCAGFWVGTVLPFGPFQGLAGHAMNGLAACGGCWALHVVLSRLGADRL